MSRPSLHYQSLAKMSSNLNENIDEHDESPTPGFMEAGAQGRSELAAKRERGGGAGGDSQARQLHP